MGVRWCFFWQVLNLDIRMGEENAVDMLASDEGQGGP